MISISAILDIHVHLMWAHMYRYALSYINMYMYMENIVYDLHIKIRYLDQEAFHNTSTRSQIILAATLLWLSDY